MSKPSYRSAEPTRCASCGAASAPDDAFLSSAGPVCAACHRRDAQLVRERDRGRANSTEALLNGGFALAAAAMLSVVAFFAPDGLLPVRALGICGLSVLALVVCALRSWRFGAASTSSRIGRALVAVSVAIGAVSAFEIVQRLVG